jgi:hypothetical protein
MVLLPTEIVRILRTPIFATFQCTDVKESVKGQKSVGVYMIIPPCFVK